MKLYMDEPEVERVPKNEETAEREAVKKTFGGEKKKLSRMKFGEKCRYVWAYYKIPIIGAAVGLLLAGYIVYFTATRKTEMLLGVVLNDTGTNASGLAGELWEYLGLTDRQEVNILDGVYPGSAASNNLYSRNMSDSTQLLAYVMAKELDFVLCDEDGLEYIKTQEICRDVLSYLDGDTAALEGLAVSDEDWDYCIAFDLTGTQFVSDMQLHQEKTYLVIVDVAAHEEQIKGFLSYVAEKL